MKLLRPTRLPFRMYSVLVSAIVMISPLLNRLKVDWIQAETKGLKLALGEEVASQLLRGCQVHWIRSCQRICDHVISTTGKYKEKAIFRTLSSAITSLHNQSEIIACFQALCSALPIIEVMQNVPSISISHDEAAWVDANCDWSCTSHWAQWWSKPQHLKMLCAPFASMAMDFWQLCPTTTNAVERKNAQCKESRPIPIKLALLISIAWTRLYVLSIFPV